MKYSQARQGRVFIIRLEDGDIVHQEIEKFVSKDRQKYKVEKNLGQLRYLSAMKHVDLLIGNTSSGIIEAASFAKPVVNIGDRQKGRLRNKNVLDTDIEMLEESIEHVLDSEFIKECKKITNFYGRGEASVQIVDYLETTVLKLTKRFYDL